MFKILSFILAFLSLHCSVRAATIGVGNVEVHHPGQKPDTRIINGHPVTPHSVPYIVAVTILSEKQKEYFCGGCLISDRHILTAGHCLYKTTISKLQFAAHNRYISEDFQVVRTNVTTVLHKDYENARALYDIGLIKLKEPVDIENNPYIKAIKLPKKEDANKTYENEMAEAFGWGWISEFIVPEIKRFPHELMGVNLTVISHHECRIEYDAKNKPRGLQDYEICTGSYNISKPVGTCKGDSGGPLVYNHTLIGVTSHGPTWFCSHNEPSVYVDVGKFLEWIEDKMQNMP